jgi:hypothetical protein
MAIQINIAQLVSDPKFQYLYSLGLINTIALRNLVIRQEYKILRDKYSVLEAIAILAETFHLSDSAVNSILFKKQNPKLLSLDFCDVILSDRLLISNSSNPVLPSH